MDILGVRRTSWLAAGGGLVVALAAMTSGPAPAAADDPPFRETVQVRVDPKAGLGNVRIELFDTATGKIVAKPSSITDLWLRLWHDTQNVKEILEQPNVAKPQPDEAAMTVEVLSVVDGKLHSDTTGTCSPFAGDVAWCKYGCDGQGFQLKRVTGTDDYELRILIGAKAAKAKHGRGPLGLTLCGADDRGYEIRVVPAGGKAEAEIKLGRH